MKDFLNFNIIDTQNFDLNTGQLLLSVIAILIWIVLVILGKRLFNRTNFAAQLGKKYVRSAKRFYFFIISFLLIFVLLKILNIHTEVVLRATLFSTKKMDIMVYHLIVLYVIIAGTRFVLALLESFFSNIAEKNRIEKGRSRSVFLIVKYLIYVIALTVFIESLGFSITIVIASVSALLVGIGLGIQHFFNDIVSGIVILFDHAIKVGDVVEIESEVIGRVVKINLRTSLISTRDEVIMIVPNSMFTTERVINWSHNSRKTRFDVKVGVAYGSDVRKVEEILIGVAKEHPHVAEKPTPFVLFYDFGNSSLDFVLKFWSEKPFYIEPIKSDLRFEIDKRFRENNVTIPFPQQDVYIKQMPNK
ncbi:MAG TPA: mechanosensitive ion channel domain-containing protein [Bacteroidales bacterium]|nr:mechanosensitive ion channel domain-containing protein [Bacteroidales bacterium]